LSSAGGGGPASGSEVENPLHLTATLKGCAFLFPGLIVNLGPHMQFGKTLRFSLCALVLLLVAACSKLCRSGYEGTDCNTLMRTKFLGVWKATTPPGTTVFTDSISNGPAPGNVTITYSFAGNVLYPPAIGNVDGLAISIPQQVDSDGALLQGTGTMNSAEDTIYWSFGITTVQNNATISYSEVWTK
jgi:hypothetical protein